MFDYFRGILVDKKYPYCSVETAGIDSGRREKGGRGKRGVLTWA